MSTVTLDIGGIRVGLFGLEGALYDEARARWRLFITDESPQFELTVRPAATDVHVPDAMPLVERDGTRYRVRYGVVSAELDLAARRGSGTVLPTVYLVDSLVRILTTLLALERDAIVVHSSGVRLDGRVLVCFGPSGVGKTTVASSVARSQVLCDEMMLLRAEGDRVLVSSTPFHGDLGFSQPGSGDLHTLVRLHQGPVDRIEELSAATAARALLNSVLFFCRDEALAERLLDVVMRVCIDRTVALTFRRETHVPTFISRQRNLRRDALPAG